MNMHGVLNEGKRDVTKEVIRVEGSRKKRLKSNFKSLKRHEVNPNFISVLMLNLQFDKYLDYDIKILSPGLLSR
jgi:hypothetical protein